jgi:hypothetical protein
MQAQLQWEQSWTQRAKQEQLRVEAGKEFVYEPYAYDWCQLFTDRRDRIINPTTGELLTVYVICNRQNPRGDCEEMQPIAGDDT